MKLPKIHFESKETKIPLAKGLRSPKLNKAVNTRLRVAENIAPSHSLLLPRKYLKQTMEPQSLHIPGFTEKNHDFKKI